MVRMQHDTEIHATPAPWRDIALVCGKCSRKLRGGFGKKGRVDLADVLKAALKEAGRRRELRTVEVGCLGLCPKHAVTVISAGRPGELLTIQAGTDPAAVLARLMPPAAAAP